MNQPLDHHYIPRFFLEPWCSADGELTCFAIKNGRLVSDRYNPTAVGKKKYLYSLNGVDPERAQIIETRLLKPLDDAAAHIHRLLLTSSASVLADEQRMSWGKFVLMLRARTPSMVGIIRAQGKATIIDEFLRNPEEFEAIRGTIPHASLLDLVNELSPALVENFGLCHVFPQLAHDSGVLPDLLKLRWHVIDLTHERHCLLLADNPVFVYGHKDRAWLWALPISPRRVFVATNRPVNYSRRMAIHANESAVRQSEQFIYATDSTAEKFIRRRWKISPLISQ